MRRRLTAVLAAIVAAFFALDLVILVSLWPQLRRVEALSTRYAASVQIITGMRGDLRDIRTTAARQRLRREFAQAPDPALDVALRSARARFDAKARSYEATHSVEEEGAVWRGLVADAAPAFFRDVDQVVAPERGRVSTYPQDIVAAIESGSQVDALLQQIIEINARQVDARAAELHSTVATVVALCVALGLLWLVGGLLLARWALAAVREYERSTEERLEELDQFAGRVAHDLRNPLQAIGMALSAIQRRTTDERTQSLSAKALQAAVRMGAFIQELLAFARSGAKPAAGASARVYAVLREVQQELAELAKRGNVALLVRASPELLAAIGPEALRSIVGNLADNAVKHSADGRERQVELTAEDGGPEIRIKVRDNGPGIAPEALSRLFDPFFRATDRPGGFGIGLKTVKRLVDAHRGRIEVGSRLGHGSVFTVTLPAAQPRAGPEASAARA
jgi:signal transduction histidine kinase